MDLSLVATSDTVIKRLTVSSIDIDDPHEKFDLHKGEKVGINWVRTAPRADHWEFELKSPKGGFFNWYAFKEHVDVHPPLASPPAGDISSQLMAMLDVIAWTEGTDRVISDGNRAGYNVIFTSDTFTNFSDHPRRLKCSGSLCSDAAGRYQFLSTTWDTLGFPNFTAANQDRGAVELIRRRGVVSLVEAGRIRAALDALSFEWASLPDSTGNGRYGQPIYPVSKVESLFVQAGGILS